MILKIKGPNSWKMFDNVENLTYSTQNKKITSERDINHMMREDVSFLSIFAYGDNLPKEIGVLDFHRIERDGTDLVSEKQYRVLFDSVVFVCNDYGKTVDKVSVDRK